MLCVHVCRLLPTQPMSLDLCLTIDQYVSVLSPTCEVAHAEHQLCLLLQGNSELWCNRVKGELAGSSVHLYVCGTNSQHQPGVLFL